MYFDSERLLGELVGDVEQLECSEIGGLVELEIEGPASSAGGRDKLVESLRRSIPCEGFSGALVE